MNANKIKLRPSGEQLALCFNWPSWPADVSFAMVVNYLRKSGYEMLPHLVRYSSDPHAQSSTYVDHLPYINLISDSEMVDLIGSNDSPVHSVSFLILDKPNTDSCVDAICYGYETNVDRRVGSSPSVEIITDGWFFSLPNFEADAKQIGSYYRQLFCNLCIALTPSYAAILHEASLPCSYSLSAQSPTSLFNNFYLDRSIVDQLDLSLEEAFSGATIAHLDAGVFVSTSKWFGGIANSVANYDIKISTAAVVKAIHKAFPQFARE